MNKTMNKTMKIEIGIEIIETEFDDNFFIVKFEIDDILSDNVYSVMCCHTDKKIDFADAGEDCGICGDKNRQVREIFGEQFVVDVLVAATAA